jgi:hypothetical protein
MTKSFSITRSLEVPCPASTNSSSADGEWLSNTSRSPRAPSAILGMRAPELGQQSIEQSGILHGGGNPEC